MTRHGFMWSVAALLGIVLAAAIAWSASLLAGQHIGLSSVPLSAVSRLAPAGSPAPAHRRPHRAQRHSRAVLPSTPPLQQQPSGGPPAPSPAPTPPSAPPAVGAASAPSTAAPPPAAAPKPPQHEGSGGSGSGGSGSGSSDKRDD